MSAVKKEGGVNSSSYNHHTTNSHHQHNGHINTGNTNQYHQASQKTQETSQQWQNFGANGSTAASKSFSQKASPRFESHRIRRNNLDGPQTEDHYRMSNKNHGLLGSNGSSSGGGGTSGARAIQRESERGSQQRLVQSGRFGIFGNYLATRISSLQQSKFLIPSPNSASRIQYSLNNFAHQNYEVYQAADLATNGGVNSTKNGANQSSNGQGKSGEMASNGPYPQFSQNQAMKDQHSKDSQSPYCGLEYGQNKLKLSDQVVQSQDYTQFRNNFGVNHLGDMSPVKKQKAQMQKQLILHDQNGNQVYAKHHQDSFRASQQQRHLTNENFSSLPNQEQQILIHQNSPTKNSLVLSQQLSISPTKLSQSQRNSAIDPQILRKSELGVAAKVASQNIRSVNVSKTTSGLPQEVHMRQISDEFYRTADNNNPHALSKDIEYLQKKQIEALLQADAGAHQIYLRQGESENQRRQTGKDQFSNVESQKVVQQPHDQTQSKNYNASSLQRKSRESSRKIAQTYDNGRKNVKIINSQAYQPTQVMIISSANKEQVPPPKNHQSRTDEGMKEFDLSNGQDSHNNNHNNPVDRFRVQLSSQGRKMEEKETFQGETQRKQHENQNIQLMIQGSQRGGIDPKRQRNSQRKFGSMKHMAHCQSNGTLPNSLAAQMKKMDNNSNSQIFKQAGNQNLDSNPKKDAAPIWLESSEFLNDQNQEQFKKHRQFGAGGVRELKQNSMDPHKPDVKLKKRPVLDLTIGPQYCTSLKQRYSGKNNFTPHTGPGVNGQGGQTYKPVLKQEDRHDYNFIVPKVELQQSAPVISGGTTADAMQQNSSSQNRNPNNHPTIQRYHVQSFPSSAQIGPDLGQLRVQRITAEQALREKQSQMRNIIVRISESANKVLNAQRKAGNHASIIENSRDNSYVGYSKRASNTVGGTPSNQNPPQIQGLDPQNSVDLQSGNGNQVLQSQQDQGYHVTIKVKENETNQKMKGVMPLLGTKADLLSDKVKHNRISIKNLNGADLDREAHLAIGKSQMLKNIQYLEQLAQQLKFRPPLASSEGADQKYKELQQNYIGESEQQNQNNEQAVSSQRYNISQKSPEMRMMHLPTEIPTVQIQTELFPKLPKRKNRLVLGENRHRAFIQEDDPQNVENQQFQQQQILIEKARVTTDQQDDYQLQIDQEEVEMLGLDLLQQRNQINNQMNNMNMNMNQRYQFRCPHAMQRKPRPPVFARVKKDNGTCNQQGAVTTDRNHNNNAAGQTEKGVPSSVSGIGSKEETKEAGGGDKEEQEPVDTRTEEQKAAEKKEHQEKLMKNFLQKFPPKRLNNGFKNAEEERKKFLEARKDANRKYTEISKDNNKPGKNGPLKFVIFEGNNCSIIRRAMHARMLQVEGDSPLIGSRQKARENPQQAFQSGNPMLSADNCSAWEEASGTHLYNFKWKPTSTNFVYDRLSKFGFKQLVNHVEGHQALTTKDQLFVNMKQHAERRQINIYNIIPLTLTVDFQQADYSHRFEQILQVVGTLEKHSDLSLEEVNKRLQRVQTQSEKVTRSPFLVGPSEHKGKNLWLLKPTGFNRGIGIHVFNSCEDLQNILWNHYRIDTRSWSQMQSITPQVANSISPEKESLKVDIPTTAEKNEKNQTTAQKTDPEKVQKVGEESVKEVKEIKNHGFIIQKYIEEPILFQRRKFDLRIWALISHDARFYLFKEAYVRTSSQEYDLSEAKMDQVYVHLTNNAVQKYSKNYGKFEEGNIVSMAALCDELAKQTNQQSKDINKDIHGQMKEQILLSYEAVKAKLNFNNKHTFELLGYDFMIVPGVTTPNSSSTEQNLEGKKLEVRMIEANTNPCLEESNQLLKTLLPRMADDMLKIVLDPLFGTNEEPNEGSRVRFPVEGYSDSENMFSLIHDKPIN